VTVVVVMARAKAAPAETGMAKSDSLARAMP
jgi:hypothetical protein